MTAVITKEGKVREVRTIRSSDDLLTYAVVTAVKRWRYSPALCDGDPVEVLFDVTTTFTLNRLGPPGSGPGGRLRGSDSSSGHATIAAADAADTALERNGADR